MNTLAKILDKNIDSFDRVFSNLYLDSYKDSFFSKPVFEEFGKHLRTNYGENENEYFIHLQLPGFKKEDLKIKFEENNLIISSELEKENEKSDKNFFRKEFEKKSFKKTYSLPKNIDKEKIEASLTDGVLDILIPKKKEENKKKEYIDILVK